LTKHNIHVVLILHVSSASHIWSYIFGNENPFKAGALSQSVFISLLWYRYSMWLFEQVTK